MQGYGTGVKGIDISNWQGDVDFNLIKEDGVKVAIVKATEGTGFLDKKLSRNYEGFKGVGIKFGTYHFFRGNSNEIDQADYYCNAIKDMKLDVAPVIDVEDGDYLGQTELTNRVIRFIDRVKERTGLTCMIYCNQNYANNFLDNRLSKYPLWIAHYYQNNYADDNKIWTKWAGWQYTDKGTIKGIDGPVDMNEFTSDIYINGEAIVSNTAQSNVTREYEEHGNAKIVVNKLNVRTAPSLRAGIVATYGHGETIYNYDRVYEPDGYRWIRYVGQSGNYRYVAVRVLATNERYAHCY